MSEQSTRHIMMMEPADFHSNPQTMSTNHFQAPDPADVAAIHDAAVAEFRAYRDRLIEAGVIVTTALGQKDCPDDIFCNNWVSTHAGSRMVLYPMQAKNRRTERRPELLKILGRYYDVALDLSAEEKDGKFLESTGALAMDRINNRVYCALSDRANKELAERWIKMMGGEIVFFETRSHVGKPIYHTDVLMYIGTGYAGICLEGIVEKDRARVRETLSKTHEIIELYMDQLRAFCGNALEVLGTDNRRILTMSKSAHDAMTPAQKKQALKYVSEIVYGDLATVEKYGGGSARCMLLEMY